MASGGGCSSSRSVRYAQNVTPIHIHFQGNAGSIYRSRPGIFHHMDAESGANEQSGLSGGTAQTVSERDSLVPELTPEYIIRDGIELAFFSFGDASDIPVVLLHGLGADHSMWTPQTDRYAREGFHLIVPEMRGHGASQVVNAFAIDDCVEDVIAVLDQLGIESAAVVGVSMGGIIGQQLAITYPNRVDKLVLSDTYSSIHGVVPRLNAAVAGIATDLLPASWQLRVLDSHFDVDEHEPLRAYFRARLLEMDPHQLRLARRAINRFDCQAELAAILAPTLVLVGERNGAWFVNLARETADGIPDARFATLRDGVDPSNLSAREEFDTKVLDFLRPV